MSRVQTFIKKEILPKFKSYMEKRGLTPYKAGAELIEIGLTRIEEHHKRRHQTVKEFLDCPVCFPRFEKAMLAKGYVKSQETQKEYNLKRY